MYSESEFSAGHPRSPKRWSSSSSNSEHGGAAPGTRDLPELSALLRFVDEGYALRSSVLGGPAPGPTAAVSTRSPSQEQQPEGSRATQLEEFSGPAPSYHSHSNKRGSGNDPQAAATSAAVNLSNDLKQMLDGIAAGSSGSRHQPPPASGTHKDNHPDSTTTPPAGSTATQADTTTRRLQQDLDHSQREIVHLREDVATLKTLLSKLLSASPQAATAPQAGPSNLHNPPVDAEATVAKALSITSVGPEDSLQCIARALQLAQHVDALVWQSERPVETALSSSNIELLQRRLDIWAQLARQGRS